MTFHIITLFPEIFESILSSSILKRALGTNQITIKFNNPRDFSKNKYKTVDDKPYGGGAGMIMKVDNIVEALESIKPKPYTILLSAGGKTYDQKLAQKLSKKKTVAIICGHYEGVDARVVKYVDEVISMGPYVLTGGEIPAAAIVDSVTRLIPGVINPRSLEEESFSKLSKSDFEYPQYTRPEDFRGHKVPKILLSGDHQKIATWRKLKSGKKKA